MIRCVRHNVFSDVFKCSRVSDVCLFQINCCVACESSLECLLRWFTHALKCSDGSDGSHGSDGSDVSDGTYNALCPDGSNVSMLVAFCAGRTKWIWRLA